MNGVLRAGLNDIVFRSYAVQPNASIGAYISIAGADHARKEAVCCTDCTYCAGFSWLLLLNTAMFAVHGTAHANLLLAASWMLPEPPVRRSTIADSPGPDHMDEVIEGFTGKDGAECSSASHVLQACACAREHEMLLCVLSTLVHLADAHGGAWQSLFVQRSSSARSTPRCFVLPISLCEASTAAAQSCSSPHVPTTRWRMQKFRPRFEARAALRGRVDAHAVPAFSLWGMHRLWRA